MSAAVLLTILDGTDEAKNSSKQANDDSLVAHYALKYSQRSLFPCFVVRRLGHQSHVEKGWEDEGEAGDKDGADKLEDSAEAWERFCQEQKNSYNKRAEHSPLHIES